MNVSEFKNIIWDYSRKINENTNNILNPICEQYGLTMLQVRILMELYRYSPHTIGSLAEGIYVAGANISAMCKKLENKGLVKRVRDKIDERVVRVGLTKQGNEIVSKMDRLLSERISQSVGSDTEEVLEDIIVGLKKFNELLKNIASVRE